MLGCGGGRSQGEPVSAFLEYREFTGNFLKKGPENSGPICDFPAQDWRFLLSDQISEQGIFLLLAGILRSVSGLIVNERPRLQGRSLGVGRRVFFAISTVCSALRSGGNLTFSLTGLNYESSKV